LIRRVTKSIIHASNTVHQIGGTSRTRKGINMKSAWIGIQAPF
jgi:hypothetical protein